MASEIYSGSLRVNGAEQLQGRLSPVEAVNIEDGGQGVTAMNLKMLVRYE